MRITLVDARYLNIVLLAALLRSPVGGIPSALQSGTNAPGSDQLIAQLQTRLAEAQVELGRFLAAGAGATNPIPGATATEVIEYQLVLQAAVRTYERQLDELAGIDALDQRQRDLAETIKSWVGFSEPPPYSVLLVDNLRDSIHSLTASIETAETTRDIFEKLGAETRGVLSQSASHLRALNEELETSSDPARMTYLTWQRTFEQARNRLATANAAAYERRRQKVAAELIEQRQRLEFARRQLILAAQHVRFSQADLDQVLTVQDNNRSQLETEYQAAQKANQLAQRELESAREDLRRSVAGQSSSGTNGSLSIGGVSELQHLVGVRTVKAETASQRLNQARQLLDLALYERAIWQTRFATFGATDPAALQKGYRRLESIQRVVQTAKPYFIHQLDLTARQIAEEQEAMQNRPEAQRNPTLARERLDCFLEREALFRSGSRSLERVERLLLRWKESLDQDRQTLPLAGRIRDVFTEFSSIVTKVWNFELFVAEDTITVDGQSVTGRRSVTVSKIAKAILILAVGYWLANLSGRLLERVAIRRFKVERHQANLIRRWTFVVLVLVLMVFSLVWVKIPFTVFAFLGGALAIGLGFGMQTLLKNFISGVIILFERPFRVGHVLDVDGHRGLVTSIGLRASVLELWDGTETLIPNSVLLENSLTNWTYSNRAVRFSISVGVAYGSDTRRVVQLLADIAERHGQVQKEPKAQVLFQDFADSALVFELRYWLDVLWTNPAQVASDLRHMIASAFASNEIEIAFPQRDLHLDAKLPLRVEVVPSVESHPAPGFNSGHERAN